LLLVDEYDDSIDADVCLSMLSLSLSLLDVLGDIEGSRMKRSKLKIFDKHLFLGTSRKRRLGILSASGCS